MANTYIGARSPKGSVGVRGVVDSGELSDYSAGTLSGFAGNSVLSWTISVGGVTGTQDVAVAKNPGGESELLVGTAGQKIDFVIGGAPGTPGQSRTDALVIYKDPFATSLVNDGIDTVDYQVVAGTAATTGTQVPPNDAAIRAAIPTGSLKFVAVIGYVTIAQGQTSVSLGNYTRNLAASKSSLLPIASSTARSYLTPFEGMSIYRTDLDQIQTYDGSNWFTTSAKFPVACKAIRNATVSVAHAVEQVITWNDEEYDYNTMHDNVTNGSRITISEDGIYLLNGFAQFASSVSASAIRFRKGGTTTLAFCYMPGSVTGLGDVFGSYCGKFTAGEYIEMLVFQSNGSSAARNLTQSVSYFSATKL